MATAIDPAGIPGDDIHPEVIEAAAARIVASGGNLRDHGATVVTQWQRLAGVYEAPEAQRLFDVITPVGSATTMVGDDLETAGRALTAFAAEVRPIVAELKKLKQQAQLFVDSSVAHGVERPVSAINSRYGMAADVAVASEKQPWDENQGAVDRNNQLWNQVATQQELLWAAERACANKIRALYGAAALHSATSENDPLGYGLDEIPDGTKMPWGASAERKEGCGEASVKFVFKGVIWDGIVVGGLWGTVQGLGTLVLGYNPETGGFLDGSVGGAAWSGVGMLAVGLITAGPAGAALGLMPGPVGDFVRGGQEALANAGKGMLAWDKWQDDPGAALGESIFNIATIVVPAGAAVTGVKTASTAGRVLTATARVMDVVDPGAWAVKGGIAGLKVVVPSVVDLSRLLRGIDVDAISNTVPEMKIPDVSSDTLGWNPARTGSDAPGFDTPKLDAPPVREPAPVSATPDATAPVVREPATISADRSPTTDAGTTNPGGGTTHPAADAAPGSTTPDAPHNTANSSPAGPHSDGGTRSGADGPSGGSGGRLDDASPSGAGSRLTDTTGGDGWQPLTHEQIVELPVVRDGTHINPDGSLQPNTWYHTGEHEYIYHTNEHGHIDHVIAEDLHIKDHDGRLPHDRNTLGKLPGDHAGHLLADLFGGSPKLDNLVSQLSDINLSKYRKIEIQWADALRSDVPGTVSVDMRIVTDPISGRPTSFVVNSIVNGRRLDRIFEQ